MSHRAVPLRFFSAIAAPDEAVRPAYWLLCQGQRVIVAEGPQGAALPCLAAPAELGITPIRRQYLGYFSDGSSPPVHCYSAEVPEEQTPPAGYAAHDLRQLFALLAEPFAAVAGRAVQVVAWDRNHQFCGRCGAQTEALDGERARVCPQCHLRSYPRLSPAIIIAVTRRFDDGERILLARNHRFPPGRYSVVAGFVEPGETLEECANREVLEETGVRIGGLHYFGSQPWPFPDSLMIGFTAEYAGGEIALEEAEIADAGWFAAHALPKLPPSISIARRLINAFAAKNGVDPATLPDW